MSSKIVALDIGEVCISIHPERVIKELGVLTGLLNSSRIKTLYTQLERGGITPDEWLEEVHKLTGGKYSKAELLAVWNTMLGDSLPGMAEAVAEAVRKGWRFIYFSNTNALHIAHFLRTNDFCHLVSGAVFSHEAEAVKPEARIYEIFEERYGVPALYFDDRQENIDAGKARGWNSVLFRSAQQIREYCR